MPKIKPIVDVAKFKKALGDVMKGGPPVPFKALEGVKKGESEPSGGLYIGNSMNRDYESQRKTMAAPKRIEGMIKRSSKDPTRRVVLETADALGQLREVAKV